jgi:hypothetical protein
MVFLFGRAEWFRCHSKSSDFKLIQDHFYLAVQDKYLLNYTERCEIINHDLKTEGIESYNILANDISKYDSAAKVGVKNVAFIYDNYTKPDEIAERYAMTKRMIPDVNIIMIPIFDECIIASNDYLYDVILED